MILCAAGLMAQDALSQRQDSLAFEVPHGTLTCRLDSLQVLTRLLGPDSLIRQAAASVSLTLRSDSTGRIMRTESFRKIKTDTVALNAQVPPSRPARAGFLKRWMEPAAVVSTLSSMVYLFYSVRSK
jgi:hypothetical protein